MVESWEKETEAILILRTSARDEGIAGSLVRIQRTLCHGKIKRRSAWMLKVSKVSKIILTEDT